MKKLFIFIFLLTTGPYVMAADRVPVMVGGNDDLDACVSVGTIKAANGVGGAHIWMGPSEDHLIFGFIKDDTRVWMCSQEGGWVGIVYSSAKEESCGVSSPINPKQPYQGKCTSGWVREIDIKPVAG